jgi:hypothetical protein
MSDADGRREGEPDAELERLRAALYAPDAPAEAAERYRAAVARRAPSVDPAPAVADDGEPAAHPPVGRGRSHRIRSAVAAGALLVAAGLAAVLLAPRPATDVTDAPLRVGPAIWSRTATTAAASPELDGRGGAVLVRLRCRGEGRVLLALDGRVRSLACVPGRFIEDDQYFEGPHDQFLLSLSLVGHPSWTASVHRVPAPVAG